MGPSELVEQYATLAVTLYSELWTHDAIWGLFPADERETLAQLRENVDGQVSNAIAHLNDIQFQLFVSLGDAPWWDKIAIAVSDAFARMFPWLDNSLEFMKTLGHQLVQDFDSGAMFDRAAGLIDGFLDMINPFDHYWSVPNIGPVFGHYDDYAFGYMVGRLTGIVAGIAISAFGPGLVACGTWAHRAMVIWEIADAAGAISGAAQNIYNNGSVGIWDILGLAGGVVSIAGLKGLMGKCFVGDTLVVYGREYVTVAIAAAAVPKEEEQEANTVAYLLGGVLLVGGGVGWYVAQRTEKQRRRLATMNSVHDMVFDEEFETLGARLPTFDLDDPEDVASLGMIVPAAAKVADSLRETRAPEAQRQCNAREPRKSRVLPSTTSSSARNRAPASVPSTATGNHDDPSATHRRLRRVARSARWFAVACLLLSAVCFWKAGLVDRLMPDSTRGTALASLLSTTTEPLVTERLLTRPIRDIRPGMRVLADNPELEDSEVDPEDITPETHRKVLFRMVKPDGSQVDFELVRSLEEIEEDGAAPGKLVQVDLDEMGVFGLAEVMEIAPCPVLEVGPGRLVTGTFRHTAANVIDVLVDGLAEPIGTTETHPFWSEDRQAFVPAGELRIGERVLSLDDGPRRITAKSTRTSTDTVYNLEVEGKHAYFVTDRGILVHNECLTRGQRIYDDVAQNPLFKKKFPRGTEELEALGLRRVRNSRGGWDFVDSDGFVRVRYDFSNRWGNHWHKFFRDEHSRVFRLNDRGYIDSIVDGSARDQLLRLMGRLHISAE